MPKPPSAAARSVDKQHQRSGLLDWIERVGNRLPDPITLFVLGALAVLCCSEIAARAGWSIENPTTGEQEVAKSLLSQDGLQWVWLHLVDNFTGFAPLGVVLVGMIGIGVAEQSGLIGALLKAMVVVTPRVLMTPAVVFVGVMSSMALDAGYIVLPPLACAVFARAGRAPLVGLAAVFAGIGAGFSANLLITGLDPLLQSFTEQAARILMPDYVVEIRCNYYFMIASTFLITLVGWAVTHWFVEPRFAASDIRAQIAAAQQTPAGDQGSASSSLAAGRKQPTDHQRVQTERLTGPELRGLGVAAVALATTALAIWAMIYLEHGALHGTVELRPGWSVAAWVAVIVPLLFVLFMVPGLAYGVATGSIKSDRDAARMMTATMSAMGSYIVLAFFAAQFISWFNESNLGKLVALNGVLLLKSLDISAGTFVVAIVLLTALLNLFIGSASAKWALISTVFVPIFAGVGISPELTQAAYRVGDSFTNIIAPLNPYIVIMLVFMRRYQPRAGIGSLISLMLPYSVAFGICWTVMLLLWMWFGWPLGPGQGNLFLS